MLVHRKESFRRHVFAVADESCLKNFKNSLCEAIFTAKYMKTHRWPHARYYLHYFLDHNYYKPYIPFLSVSRMSPTNKFIPPTFVCLFKMTLYRLVGSGMMSKQLVCKRFWTLIKSKFTNAQAYAKRMVKYFFPLTIYFIYIFIYIYIYIYFF